MEILPERVDTQIKAQGKRKSLHSLKPKESSLTEILPKRVDTQVTSLKQSEMIESIVIKNQFHAKKFIIKELKLKDSPWYKKDDLIHWKTLLYILPNPQLQEQIIQQNHDHPLAGHCYSFLSFLSSPYRLTISPSMYEYNITQLLM